MTASCRREAPAARVEQRLRCYDHARMWFIELAQDFLYFLKERKAWWLTPIVVVLLLLTVLILVGEKAAVLPFIYILF
jgi:hypothetical protein